MIVLEGGRNKQEVELPDLIKEMGTIIDDVNEYALQRGELGGLDWGIECFNEAFEGLNPGLHLVAGQANVGKSALCMQLAWSIANANKTKTEKKPHKAYVLYFSLDDNVKEILPRLIALDQKIPINVVTKPKKYQNDPSAMPYLVRREEGIRRLRNAIPYIKVVDSNYVPMADTIEVICKTIGDHNFALKEMDEDYKLVVFIDNFHDISSSETNFNNDENAKFTHISGELGSMCTQYDIPIICTAEFKKLNGARRPIIDDVKSTGKIAYEAKAIMLCYNEVGLRGESAQVFWEQDGINEKRPLLEVKVGKNKLSSYKKRMFFEFVPEMSYLREVPPEGTRRYNQMING